MIEIEVPDENDALFEVVLDGKTYYFNTCWSDFAGYWRLDILDVNRKPLLYGLPMLNDTDMTKLHRYKDIPQKPLRAIMLGEDTGNLNPSRTDFRDGKAKLFYGDEED